jgi:hypothetical protein
MLTGRTYSRPACYQAPSWSWASLDGEICFHKDLEWTLEPKSHRTIVLIRTVSTRGSIYTGPVTGGSLVIKGLIRKIPSIRCIPLGKYYGGYDNYKAMEITL